MRYLTKGHRGIIYTADCNGGKVVLKMKLPESRAVGRIANEVNWLRKLNRKGIGPKLVFPGKDWFAMEYIKGQRIVDFITKSEKAKTRSVLKAVLQQCFALDKLHLDKEEMHRPVKHIIVQKSGKPVMIDFERCHKVRRAKNVTQFCQFIMSLSKILADKGIKINKEALISRAREYKGKQTARNLDRITGLI